MKRFASCRFFLSQSGVALGQLSILDVVCGYERNATEAAGRSGAAVREKDANEGKGKSGSSFIHSGWIHDDAWRRRLCRRQGRCYDDDHDEESLLGPTPRLSSSPIA